MENQNILFYDLDAVCKYNVDKNGLYLNDELGLKDQTTPYYGVIYNKTAGLYVPIPHIKRELYEKLRENIQIRQCIAKGLDFEHVRDWPISMPGVKDIRDAAYIAQLFRFADNNEDLIICYFLHKYVKFDEYIDKLFKGVNDWLFEPVTRAYDPKDDTYKIKQSIIDSAKREKIRRRQELEKRKIQIQNEQNLMSRMEIYAKQKGFKIDKMDLKTAQQLLAIKMTEENQIKASEEEAKRRQAELAIQAERQRKIEMSKQIIKNMKQQERMFK